jgi:hypothetical protein
LGEVHAGQLMQPGGESRTAAHWPAASSSCVGRARRRRAPAPGRSGCRGRPRSPHRRRPSGVDTRRRVQGSVAARRRAQDGKGRERLARERLPVPGVDDPGAGDHRRPGEHGHARDAIRSRTRRSRIPSEVTSSGRKLSGLRGRRRTRAGRATRESVRGSTSASPARSVPQTQVPSTSQSGMASSSRGPRARRCGSARRRGRRGRRSPLRG